MRLVFDPSGFQAEIPDAVASLAEAYGSEMMDSAELLHLAGAALAHEWTNDGVVVEIGSFIGLTAAFLAESLAAIGRRTPILSIDPFERVQLERIGGVIPRRGNPRGKYRRYLRTVRAKGVEDRCLPLVAFSQDAAPVVPNRVGLLVVDGDHHYENVAADLELYAPKVLPGGFIFVDDYSAQYPGVIRATDEFLAGHVDLSLLHKTYFAIAQKR